MLNSAQEPARQVRRSVLKPIAREIKEIMQSDHTAQLQVQRSSLSGPWKYLDISIIIGTSRILVPRSTLPVLGPPLGAACDLESTSVLVASFEFSPISLDKANGVLCWIGAWPPPSHV